MNIPAAAAALMELAPDVVFLQEVQRRQLGELRVALHATDARWRFKHWGVKIPAEGLGVLATVPLRNVQTQTLAHRWEFWNWRRRIAIHFEVVLGDRVLRAVDVHLGAGVPHEERVRQTYALLLATAGVSFICGDLNAEPNSRELDVLAEAGWHDAERRLHADVPRPSTNWPPGPRTQPPTQRLDYLLVTDDAQVLDAFVPTNWSTWAALSDHLPVVAHLQFTNGELR